jgi:hypothetical protein
MAKKIKKTKKPVKTVVQKLADDTSEVFEQVVKRKRGRPKGSVSRETNLKKAVVKRILAKQVSRFGLDRVKTVMPNVDEVFPDLADVKKVEMGGDKLLHKDGTFAGGCAYNRMGDYSITALWTEKDIQDFIRADFPKYHDKMMALVNGEPFKGDKQALFELYKYCVGTPRSYVRYKIDKEKIKTAEGINELSVDIHEMVAKGELALENAEKTLQFMKGRIELLRESEQEQRLKELEGFMAQQRQEIQSFTTKK